MLDWKLKLASVFSFLCVYVVDATAARIPACAAETMRYDNWQTYNSASSQFTVKYPTGWNVVSDPKTGRIDISDATGAELSILPFSLDSQLTSQQALGIFGALLHSFAPSESWSNPQVVNATTVRSVHSDDKFKSSAVCVFTYGAKGTDGKFCIAKMPANASENSSNMFAAMMTSLRFNGSNSAQPQTPQAGSLPPTPFMGYQTFTDPNEHAFSCEVPVGWKIEGGLARASSIDARPWVKATSPDNLIVAFIGDDKIPPYSMPTATGMQLGFGVGAKYGGGEVRNYVPARRYVEQYVRNSLKGFISNIQVVEAYDHPDVAAAINGTVGATKSEAASIKFTGMYKDIPAVGYYLASTKATVAYGTGMWWVSLLAGELSPADRSQGGLSVILHMIQTFKMDPVWKNQSVANAGEVSRQYTAQSQAVSNSIMSRYWSQQAANDANHAAYWGRQAAQDHAANNFSDYIRGTQTVQDPSTGSQYKVNYGPQYHWIDNSGNYAGTNYSAPGPEWRQLMNVP
ncbi:MAG: hypothetical protein JST89_21025 [Cyanobacteria bacterium SZAS-4]|nr:hypothetical protein [Cyanobacteria bacterium SZAS-4]